MPRSLVLGLTCLFVVLIGTLVYTLTAGVPPTRSVPEAASTDDPQG